MFVKGRWPHSLGFTIVITFSCWNKTLFPLHLLPQMYTFREKMIKDYGVLGGGESVYKHEQVN